ncbi:MAG: hypothetical protein RPS47_11255, partial [Colwellia sp.]
MLVKAATSNWVRLPTTIKKLGLHNKLALLSLSLIVLQIASLGFFSIQYLKHNLEQQIGNTALSIARSLAQSHVIRQGLTQRDSASIQKYVENIR